MTMNNKLKDSQDDLKRCEKIKDRTRRRIPDVESTKELDSQNQHLTVLLIQGDVILDYD